MLSHAKKLILFSRFPEFELAHGIKLRKPKITDAQALLSYLSKPEVAKYVPDSCIPKNIAHAEKEILWYINLFNNRQGFSWAIVKQDEMIGSISFEKLSLYHKRCEIAYDLDPSYWGQGIMHNSINACLKFAFNKVHLLRVEAYTTLCNSKSIKLLTKLNFNHEAVLRQHRWFKNQQIDVNLFAILRNEYDR